MSTTTAAGIVLAFAAAAGVMVGGMVVWRMVGRKAFQSLSVKAGPVQIELQAVRAALAEVKSDTAEINASVNGVKPGAPKLRQTAERTARTVDYLTTVVAWQSAGLLQLAALGGVTLDPPPDPPAS